MKVHLFLGILLLPFMLMAGAEDSVVITGSFTGDCHISTFTLQGFDIMNPLAYTGKVKDDGSFSLTIPYSGARQYTLNSGKWRADIVIDSIGQIYQMDVSCQDGEFISKIKNSPDNEAYSLLGNIIGKLVGKCRASLKNSSNTDALNQALSELIVTHNSELEELNKNFPGTFTTTHLTGWAKMPVVFGKNMIDSLIAHQLRKSAWNDPAFYHTDLPIAYMSLIKILSSNYNEHEKDALVIKMLSASPPDRDAAKCYQQIIFESFFYRRDEKMLRLFSDWALQHPAGVVNPVLKTKLSGIGKTLPGSKFIEVASNDLTDKEQKLSNAIKNHLYTLVLFWSPNCEHCRNEMPNIISFYNKYHPKGIEIFGVGMDSELSEWKAFVTQKELPWVNIHDIADQPAASAYMVTNTPDMILIDKQGVILSRYGDLERIEKILSDKGVK